MSGQQGGSGPDPRDESFEARLRQARTKAGLERPAKAAGPGEPGGSALGVGLRVGVELVSALAVAVAIGYFLDRWLHTMPLFIVVFVVLGGVAGVMNVWRVMGPQRGAAPPGNRPR